MSDVELPGYVELPLRIELQIRDDGIATRAKNSRGNWWVVFRNEGGDTDTMPEDEWNYERAPVTREWDGQALIVITTT